MTKRTYNHVKLEDFEIKAQEFISLTFDLSELELRKERRHDTDDCVPRRKALQFAALSVHDSIKAFLVIIQIERK